MRRAGVECSGGETMGDVLCVDVGEDLVLF